MLPPDYPQGIQSKVREEVLLWALYREEEAKAAKEGTLLAETIVAPHLDVKKVIPHSKTVLRRWNWLHKYGLYSREEYRTAEEQLREDSADMVKVWNEAEKSGRIAQLRELFRKIEEQAKRDEANQR
jgi:hypothetical protein